MNRLGLLLLLAALLTACAPEGPATEPTSIAATPTMPAPTAVPTPETPAVASPTAVTAPSPTAAPVATPTAMPIEQPDIRCESDMLADDNSPELGEVIEQLGFAFQPAVMPSGFDLAGVSFNNNQVRQIYQSEEKNIIVAYPLEFSPDTSSDPLGWERPQDAVSSLQIGDQTAHLMIGGWSDASIIAGPALRPDRAEWDYDKSLALFFSCRADDGRDVAVAIQASQSSTGPIGWIDADDIVEIAHSLRRISSPQ